MRKSDLVVGAVLSGNRNFEGRVNADVKANYLASPPLVVAYALAGTLNKDLTTEPLGQGSDGQPVYLKDIWPTSAGDRRARSAPASRPTCSPSATARVFEGDEKWRAMGKAKPSLTYRWNSGSTYVQNPPYFEGLEAKPSPDRRRGSTRACSVSSRTASPPTTSRPPARSSGTGRPAST